MKIYDMHIHAWNTKPNPEELLSRMESVGCYGGCVFSNSPKEALGERGSSFEERLAEVLSWSKGYEDRIFPVLWIHPYEENIIEKLRLAAERGIAAFKIICTDFYVYEEGCMQVLREIARLDKPVIFHTGILWDGAVSSNYNRPLGWEALLDIEGLRFSMGHCSWPWVDECIALYGKFLNAMGTKKSSEMFFDITPGTPEIYREELLTKLYTIGYNVGDNIMFGTDSSADGYRSEWSANWLDIDRKILDKLGVSNECREKLYYKNLMRFLGKDKTVVTKAAPTTDNSHAWTPVNPEVKNIIKKWYGRLEFPKYFDREFKSALNSYDISDAITIENYDKSCKDGKRNLLSYLYLCEQVEENYKKLGIPDDILIDTLKDVVTWCKTWSCVKGEMYLGELSWLAHHFSMKLFKLGRLQFCMGRAEEDIPEYNISKGDNVLEVHIPAGDKLDANECLKSIERARPFFKKHFPDFEFTSITCHSWLLDDTLSKYLSESSNIIKFGNLFKRIDRNESYAIIRYLFRWNTTPDTVCYEVANSSFTEKVKRAVMCGEKFYEVLGVIVEDKK